MSEDSEPNLPKAGVMALISRRLPQAYTGPVIQCIQSEGWVPFVYWGVIPKKDSHLTNSVIRSIEADLFSCCALILIAHSATDFRSDAEYFHGAVERIVQLFPRTKIFWSVVSSQSPRENISGLSVRSAHSVEDLQAGIIENLASMKRG